MTHHADADGHEPEKGAFTRAGTPPDYARAGLLEAIFTTTPDLFVLKDRQSLYQYVNPAFCRFLGRPAEEIIGKSDHELFPPEDAEAYLHGDATVMQTGRQETGEWQVSGAEGKRWLRVTKTAVRDGSGAVLGVLCSVSDITEGRRAAMELARLEGQLRQAQRMEAVGRLAGGVAHEFNNMLTVILGHTELALEGPGLDGRLREALGEVQLAADRSAVLTRQLLAFARKAYIAPAQIDLNEAIGEELDRLRAALGDGVVLEWRPGRGLWPVLADPALIADALKELCRNAREAVQEDGGHLTLETQNQTVDAACGDQHPGFLPGEYAVVSVCDNGRGMEGKTVNRVFEPFFTSKGVGEGTGLGLAMVYGIVKQHHGHIHVYSEPGVGTTFRVYLPRCPDAVGEAPAPAAHEDTRATGTILLVDDDVQALRLTAAALRDQGYTVLAAATPGEAVRLARQHPARIDLTITDVFLPDINGRDLVARLLPRHPGMAALYVSGYPGNTLLREGMVGSGALFLQKPFNRQELAAKVGELLRTE